MEIDVSSVFYQMVILFLIMAIGYVAGKTRVMSIEGNKTLSRLINCITNPCNILYSAICTEHTLSNREVVGIIGIAAAMYAVLILLAQAVPPLLRVPKEQGGQYKFMIIFSNIGYMGIPVISAIYGPSAVFEIAIFIMMFNVLAYTYGLYLICGGHRGSGFRAKDLLTPMTVTALSSLVLYFLNVQAPPVIASTLNTVRSITTPGAMLIIGCALSSVPVRDIFSNWRLYVIAALKLLVIPVAGYFVLRPLISNPLVLGVVVAVLGMPIASNFTMLSAQYDRDQKLAASSVFITTLLSVATIPLLMGLLFAG